MDTKVIADNIKNGVIGRKREIKFVMKAILEQVMTLRTCLKLLDC